MKDINMQPYLTVFTSYSEFMVTFIKMHLLAFYQNV